MGFHDGVAEKLVLRAFRKYEAASAMARQERSAAGAAADGERLPPAAAAASSSSPPEPCPATPADAPADAAPLPPPDSASEEAQLAAASGPAPTGAGTATVPPGPLARPPEAPYNGGHTARYSWEQTLHDVSLHVRTAADAVGPPSPADRADVPGTARAAGACAGGDARARRGVRHQ